MSRLPVLLLLLALSLAACTKPQTTAPAPSAPAPKTSCPDSSHTELLTVQASPESKLRVCGYALTERTPPPGKIALAGFRVYREGDPKPVFAADAELDNYYASVTADKKLLLEELFWFKDFEPLIAITIQCTGTQCTQSKPTCALKLPANPYPNAMDDLRAPVLENQIGRAGIQALSGDPKALRFFDHADHGLILDGAVGLTYQTARENIQKARAAGCPLPPRT
jgi:hypothetical protein